MLLAALGKRKVDDAAADDEPPAKHAEVSAESEERPHEVEQAAQHQEGGEQGREAAADPTPHQQLPRSEMSADGTKLTIEVAPEMVGKIIGKRGETIKSIQNNSGARVDVDQQFPEGQPRKVRLHMYIMHRITSEKEPRGWYMRGLQDFGRMVMLSHRHRRPDRALALGRQVYITGAPASIETARIMVENMLNPTTGGVPPAGAEEKARLLRGNGAGPDRQWLTVPQGSHHTHLAPVSPLPLPTSPPANRRSCPARRPSSVASSAAPETPSRGSRGSPEPGSRLTRARTPAAWS